MRSPVTMFTRPQRLMRKYDEIKQTTQYLFACTGAEPDIYIFLPVPTDTVNVQFNDESLGSDAHQSLSLSVWKWVRVLCTYVQIVPVEESIWPAVYDSCPSCHDPRIPVNYVPCLPLRYVEPKRCTKRSLRCCCQFINIPTTVNIVCYAPGPGMGQF